MPLARFSKLGFRALVRLILAAALLSPVAARPPNIVFILADDLGYTDLACFGSRYYETPHLDRLATRGIRFTNHHHHQNCAPTRAALMTGQYSVRTGVYTVGNIDRFDWSSRPLRPADNVTNLPLDRVLLPQVLKRAGYATAMFGKWHLGQQGDYHPARRGFDEAIESAGQHYDFRTNPAVEVPKGKYLADFLTDRAVDFIRRNRERPFFLYLPHFAVHTPIQGRADLVAKYQARIREGMRHRNAAYAAMTESLDSAVGRVVATLERLRLRERTIIVFTSDNGGRITQGTTTNTPLRFGKASAYEGGVRVPLIINWPGVIRPGGVSDAPVITMDIFPTLVELAGLPASAGRTALDGVSLAAHLRGGPAPRRDTLFWHYPHHQHYQLGGAMPYAAIRAGDYKLIEFYHDLKDIRLELYDLRADIGETKDLAAAEPKRVAELRARLHAWQREVGAQMPTPNPSYNPAKPEYTPPPAKAKKAAAKG